METVNTPHNVSSELYNINDDFITSLFQDFPSIDTPIEPITYTELRKRKSRNQDESDSFNQYDPSDSLSYTIDGPVYQEFEKTVESLHNLESMVTSHPNITTSLYQTNIHRTVPAKKKKSKDEVLAYDEQIDVINTIIPMSHLTKYCFDQQLLILNKLSPFKLYLYEDVFTIFMGASKKTLKTKKPSIIYYFLWGDQETDIVNSPAVAQLMKETLFIYGILKTKTVTLDPYNVSGSLEKIIKRGTLKTNGYYSLKYKVDNYIPPQNNLSPEEMINHLKVSINEANKSTFSSNNYFELKKLSLKNYARLQTLLTPQARDFYALPGAKASIKDQKGEMVFVFEPSSYFLPERMTENPYEEMKKQFERFEEERKKKLRSQRIDPNTINFSNRIALDRIIHYNSDQ